VTLFRYLLRVRYHECDAQKIVFNARYAEYADLATTEFLRAVLGGVQPEELGIDYRVARLALEWKAAARFDDVLALRVAVPRTGTTSFVVRVTFERWPDGRVLATSESTLVRVDPISGAKVALGPLSTQLRAGSDRTVDHAGALTEGAR
jgi:acyl-CoA thioester hydrolase